jgi:hypothetical protein
VHSLLEIEKITPKSKDKEISNMGHRPMDYGMKSLLYTLESVYSLLLFFFFFFFLGSKSVYNLLEIEKITSKSKDKEISNMGHRPMDYGMKSLLYTLGQPWAKVYHHL